MFSLQIASLPILANLFKDHLVKDGTSLTFVTNVFKSYLKEQTIDHLTINLKKSGVGNRLLDFFPQSKQTSDYLISHFTTEKLPVIVDFHKKLMQSSIKQDTTVKLVEMLKSDSKSPEMISYLKQIMNENGLPEAEVIIMLFDSMISSIDWGSKPDQVDVLFQKFIPIWATSLVPFCTVAKTEISFLLKIQSVCYETSVFQKSFAKIVQLLYKFDVVSDSAIVYWFDKGAGAQGKTLFLKQMETFVVWIRKQMESEEGED